MAGKRRGRGEGSVETLPSGQFRVIVSAGIDPATKKRRKMTATFPTKREALDWMREQHSRQQRGTLPSAGRMTIADWLTQWLAIKEATIQPGSYDFYRQRSDKYLTPTLGPVKLRELQAIDIDALHAKLTKDKVPAPEQRKVAVTLSVALNDAVKRNLIPTNPAKQVKKPRVAASEVDPFSLKEVQQFLAVARTKRLGAMYELALDAGMRPGELLGLHWPEIDLEGCRVTVRQSLEERKSGFRLKEPKSKAGRRTIRICPATAEALKRHRERMADEGRDVDRGPVFVNLKGEWLSQPTTYRRVWLPILKEAKLRHFTPYATRHTMACWLLTKGINIKYVSKRLGHENIETTIKHYIHVLPDSEDEAVEALQSMFRLDSPTGVPQAATVGS